MMEASPFSEGHPLLNHVVLKRLFNLMKFDIDEFANLRLVCRQWFKESLPIWRKNAVLCVDDQDYWEHLYYETYLKYFEEPDSSLYQMRKYPYCSYHVWRCYIRFRGRSGELSTRFWTKVGPLMTYLTIRGSHFFLADDLRKVIFELTPNLRYLGLHTNFYNENRPQCDLKRTDPSRKEHKKPPQIQPNLLEFRVEIEHWDPPEPGQSDFKLNLTSLKQELPISWMEIFVHFPNLKVLDLSRLCGVDPEGELGEVVKTLKTIRREVGQEYFAGLEKLLLEDADSRTVTTLCPITVEKICELQFPLKKLTFDVGLRTEETTFTRLLEAHSTTLKSLDICKDRFSPPFQTQLLQTNFELLTHLDLLGPILHNLNFVKSMPNLETLYLRDERGDLSCVNANPDLQPPSKMIGNTDFLQLEGVVLHKMKHLYIGEELCSSAQVGELAKLMPNLRRLRLGLGDDGFKMVCQTWEKLEALDIHPCQVTGKGMLENKGGRKFQLTDILPL